MKKAPLVALALSIILGLATIPVVAAGGRVPIYQVPSTIDTPGSYYVSRDLTGSSGAALITIASDDVTLDLADHTIRRTDAGGDMIASFGNRTNIEIRNGRIEGMLKDVAYQIRTPEFWNSMDQIGGPSTYQLGGPFGDGKGQPGQANAVSHGCPASRFRDVTVINTARGA